MEPMEHVPRSLLIIDHLLGSKKVSGVQTSPRFPRVARCSEDCPRCRWPTPALYGPADHSGHYLCRLLKSLLSVKLLVLLRRPRSSIHTGIPKPPRSVKVLAGRTLR